MPPAELLSDPGGRFHIFLYNFRNREKGKDFLFRKRIVYRFSLLFRHFRGSIYFVLLVKNLHKLFARDSFLFIKERGKLVEFFAVFGDYPRRFRILLLNKVNDLFVHFALRFRGAGKLRVAAEILIGLGFKRNHTELVAHTVTGYHGARKVRCLFDVV